MKPERTKQADIPDKYSPDWLQRLDGRTAIAKAVNQRMRHLVNDLGGADSLSYQEQSIVRRVVWVESLIESAELEMAKGRAMSTEDHRRHLNNINTLIGLLKSLGLERRTRDVPSLGEYLAAKGGAA